MHREGMVSKWSSISSVGFEDMPLPLLPLPLGLVTRGPQKPVLGEFHPYQTLELYVHPLINGKLIGALSWLV